MISYQWEVNPEQLKKSRLRQKQRELSRLKRKHKQAVANYGRFSGTRSIVVGLERSIKECENQILKLA